MVEISADRDPPRMAEARAQLPNGTILEEEIKYEWYPERCNKCSSFGHDLNSCPMNPKWIPKDSSKEPSKEDTDLIGLDSQIHSVHSNSKVGCQNINMIMEVSHEEYSSVQISMEHPKVAMDSPNPKSIQIQKLAESPSQEMQVLLQNHTNPSIISNVSNSNGPDRIPSIYEGEALKTLLY